MRSERNACPLRRAVVDHDLVDELTARERFEAPREMRSVDPEHRRARADERVEGDDGLVGMLGGHALHHVDLGADGEHRSRRRRLDPFEDALGRSDAVGDLDDLVRALGVDDHLTSGMLGAECVDVLGSGTAGVRSSAPSTAGTSRP